MRTIRNRVLLSRRRLELLRSLLHQDNPQPSRGLTCCRRLLELSYPDFWAYRSSFRCSDPLGLCLGNQSKRIGMITYLYSDPPSPEDSPEGRISAGLCSSLNSKITSSVPTTPRKSSRYWALKPMLRVSPV